MADIDTIKAEIKKLNAKATQAKMDLHDLSEELPTNWERIPEVARIEIRPASVQRPGLFGAIPVALQNYF